MIRTLESRSCSLDEGNSCSVDRQINEGDATWTPLCSVCWETSAQGRKTEDITIGQLMKEHPSINRTLALELLRRNGQEKRPVEALDKKLTNPDYKEEIDAVRLEVRAKNR